jgi:hypothetical protein
MIDTRELRIGNWVEYSHNPLDDEGNIEWRPTRIDYNDISYLCQYPDEDDYRPIPLTEEILLKAGFRETIHGFTNDVLRLGYITTDDYYQCILTPQGNRWLLIPMQYLHQLQNLYFALTGQELNIEL